ncbi:MAG: hypothetical protein QM756_35495 [Polyangiaceae bacterium]
MTVKIRPRIATVVGVVWLYLSAAWVPIGTSTILMGVGMLELSGAGPEPFAAFAVFGGLVTLLAGFAGHAAYELLEMRSRGRQRLELINWSTFALFQAFTWHVAWQLTSTTRYWGTERFLQDPGRFLLIALCGLFSSLPYLVMALKLRNPELRYAIRDAELTAPSR